MSDDVAAALSDKPDPFGLNTPWDPNDAAKVTATLTASISAPQHTMNTRAGRRCELGLPRLVLGRCQWHQAIQTI